MTCDDCSSPKYAQLRSVHGKYGEVKYSSKSHHPGCPLLGVSHLDEASVIMYPSTMYEVFSATSSWLNILSNRQHLRRLISTCHTSIYIIYLPRWRWVEPAGDQQLKALTELSVKFLSDVKMSNLRSLRFGNESFKGLTAIKVSPCVAMQRFVMFNRSMSFHVLPWEAPHGLVHFGQAKAFWQCQAISTDCKSKGFNSSPKWSNHIPLIWFDCGWIVT